MHVHFHDLQPFCNSAGEGGGCRGSGYHRKITHYIGRSRRNFLVPRIGGGAIYFTGMH